MSVAVIEGPSPEHNPVEERCDRCGARGYIRMTKLDSVLIFCNHHGDEFNAALIKDGWSSLKVHM